LDFIHFHRKYNTGNIKKKQYVRVKKIFKAVDQKNQSVRVLMREQKDCLHHLKKDTVRWDVGVFAIIDLIEALE
jgi:hypothetical protein